jgi:hypothetical protein
MNLLMKKTPVITSKTDRGLKVCYSTTPGYLRLWIPFKHQFFIEYRKSDKSPLDIYGDIPGLMRNPKYLALVTKTFDHILIKDDRLEVQIKLDADELKIQSQKTDHPELNHWLEEMAQILISYNLSIPKRSFGIPFKSDQVSANLFKYFPLTVPAFVAIIYPFINTSSLTMVEWKEKIQLLVGFGFVFGGLLIVFKVRLWLRIFFRLYILALSGLTIAFLLMELGRRFVH